MGTRFLAPERAGRFNHSRIQLPTMLPLNMLNKDTIYSTSTDIVLFHIIVPMVLKYARPLTTLKVRQRLLCCWTIAYERLQTAQSICLWWLTAMGSVLGLGSYLFERNPQQVRLPSLFPLKVHPYRMHCTSLLGTI